MNFENKTAIITGGTGALGKVVMQKFFDANANIALPVHSSNSIGSLPSSITKMESRFFAMSTDLLIEIQVNAFVNNAVGKFGGVHFLINIAGGYAAAKSVEEVSLDDWESMMNLNLKTAFLMCRTVLPTMRKQEFGRIVNIASMHALAPKPNAAPYAVSKRGVVTLTETIAEETKGTGITANAIAPSTILTEANKQSMPGADFSKWVTPEEIADTILFLCSDGARSMSGNVIKMYGGV
jgi:NAD(P)-dependent dehydrogenase (short-subunit alcohol dehydrogenase family)